MAIEAGQVRARGLGWVAWLVLAAAWFATLHVRPMFDPDEGRYAEIPREMAATGDWLTPRLNGLKYFEKPPLQYWATAAAYSGFGISEWTSRLWTVGLAFACLPMVFGWTRRLYGRNAALAAVVALCVSPYFGIVGHLDLLDAGFSFWLTGAVFAFTLAQTAEVRSREERRWMLIAWVAAALAILSKGIVVGVLTGASLIVYSCIERDIRPWKRLHAAVGVPLFLLVAAPWFIAVSIRNPDFPQFFFIHEHFARFLTNVHQRVEPWWFFLPPLLLGVLPWARGLVGGVVRAWRDAGPTPQFKPLRFLLIFAVFTLVFFSASGSKLAPYIQPMFPPLAVVVGVYLAERVGFLRSMAVITAILVSLVSVGVLIYSAIHNSFIPQAATVWAAIAVVVMLVAVYASWSEQRTDASAPAVVIAAAAAFGWQCFMTALGIVPPARSARDLVAEVKPYVHPQTQLYSVGQYRETISPYLERTLTVVEFEGELEFGLHAEPGKQLATPADFVTRWDSSTDAVAFFGPKVWDTYRHRGLPGRVIAADNYTIAVSRS
jgi:4-amino-4-deoxy-L-arabinose transferase-like glycosyltransferase